MSDRRFLTTASQILCPHGASVVSTATQDALTQDGFPVLTMETASVVAGCPFTPDDTPCPCTTVQWVPDGSGEIVGGSIALDDRAVGICANAAGAAMGSVEILRA